ncbi:MAG: hypothetical protein KF894_22020 [Labilithrix sp.]|nr:hypothetical protein [Labilithrix sp.]
MATRAARSSRPRRVVTAVVVLVAALCGSSRTARAEEATDYCRKVTARAEGDAALLFAPTLHAQVIRYPASGVADVTGMQVGSGVQPRAAMSLGLIDIYRGLGVLDAAKTDCSRQQTAAALQETMIHRGDIGRRPALERESDYLHSQRSVVEGLVRDVEARFAAGIETLLEVHELRRRAFEIERRIAEVDLEIEVLKKRRDGEPESLAEALQAYESRAVAHEESVAHVRNLQPWKLDVRGGATMNGPVDAFAVAELAYNFGGIFHVGAERRAVSARAAELRNARYEMRQQIERLMSELRASAEKAKAQVRVIDQEIERIAIDRASIEALDAPKKPHVLAVLTLEAIQLEAKRAYLSTLAERHAATGGAK